MKAVKYVKKKVNIFLKECLPLAKVEWQRVKYTEIKLKNELFLCFSKNLNIIFIFFSKKATFYSEILFNKEINLKLGQNKKNVPTIAYILFAYLSGVQIS